MKGGFNNPPNSERSQEDIDLALASMKGGFNNPPNCGEIVSASYRFCRFNEGGVQ